LGTKAGKRKLSILKERWFDIAMLERQVDFIKYFSADFSLCENSWIFFTYLGAISGFRINSVPM
jgi:hypothetical protein